MSDNTIPCGRRLPRRSRLVALLMLAVLAFSGVAACSSDNSSDSSATRVVDTVKGKITVPAKPQRIVSLAASLTGFLYSLDAPVAATDTKVLGVTNLSGGFPPEWAAKAKEQKTAELPSGTELNLDAITKANPDMIIAGGQGYAAVQAEKAYDQLSKIAPTVYISPKADTWQEQLKQVANAVNRTDKVDSLMKAYSDKVAEVKKSIKIPGSPVDYFLSLSTNEPSMIPSTSALPELMSQLGFVADNVVAKAGNPQLYGSGDSFVFSNEQLSKIADAPVMFVIPVAGRTLAQLKTDPLYQALPAFKNNKVYELPATSYRADYDGVMNTLDLVQKMFS